VTVKCLKLETINESAQEQDSSARPRVHGVHDAVGVTSELVQVDRTKTRAPPDTNEQPQVTAPSSTKEPAPNQGAPIDIKYIEVTTND